jgi:hypothetical protein
MFIGAKKKFETKVAEKIKQTTMFIVCKIIRPRRFSAVMSPKLELVD